MGSTEQESIYCETLALQCGTHGWHDFTQATVSLDSVSLGPLVAAHEEMHDRFLFGNITGNFQRLLHRFINQQEEGHLLPQKAVNELRAVQGELHLATSRVHEIGATYCSVEWLDEESVENLPEGYREYYLYFDFLDALVSSSWLKYQAAYVVVSITFDISLLDVLKSQSVGDEHTSIANLGSFLAKTNFDERIDSVRDLLLARGHEIFDKAWECTYLDPNAPRSLRVGVEPAESDWKRIPTRDINNFMKLWGRNLRELVHSYGVIDFTVSDEAYGKNSKLLNLLSDPTLELEEQPNIDLLVWSARNTSGGSIDVSDFPQKACATITRAAAGSLVAAHWPLGTSNKEVEFDSSKLPGFICSLSETHSANTSGFSFTLLSPQGVTCDSFTWKLVLCGDSLPAFAYYQMRDPLGFSVAASLSEVAVVPARSLWNKKLGDRHDKAASYLHLSVARLVIGVDERNRDFLEIAQDLVLIGGICGSALRLHHENQSLIWYMNGHIGRWIQGLKTISEKFTWTCVNMPLSEEIPVGEAELTWISYTDIFQMNEEEREKYKDTPVQILLIKSDASIGTFARVISRSELAKLSPILKLSDMDSTEFRHIVEHHVNPLFDSVRHAWASL